MDPKFGCHECGKTYKWKPELAGRKVKCKCGAVMTAPKAPPAAADEPDLDALYDLADAGQAAAAAAPAMIRCPSCQGEMEPGTQVCPSCGFNLKTGRKAKAGAAAGGGGGGGGRAPSAAAIPAGAGGAAAATAGAPSALGAYQAFGKPRRGLQKDDTPSSNAVEWYIPIALIVVGLALSVLQAAKFNTFVYPLPQAFMFAGVRLVISLVLLGIGCYLAVKWGEVSFGSPGPAALKIVGLAMAPSALAFIVSFLIHDLWGFVGFFLAFGIYFVLCNYLFEWDMSEKWIVTGLLCVVCMVATPYAASYAVSGGVPGVSVASKQVKNEDASIDYMIELGTPKDAQKWIDESGGRICGDMTREESVALISALYDLKPKDNEMWIVPEGPQAAEILIKLPSDEAKRKKFFDWRAGLGPKLKAGGTRKDEGNKWFIVGFFPVMHPEPIGF